MSDLFTTYNALSPFNLLLVGTAKVVGTTTVISGIGKHSGRRVGIQRVLLGSVFYERVTAEGVSFHFQAGRSELAELVRWVLDRVPPRAVESVRN